MKMYAYARVSSKDQCEDRQIIAFREMNIPESNIYIDKQSGKDFNRKQYQKMIKKLKTGDVLFIKSIDRLGRNYEAIKEQWELITKKKNADIVVLDMPILDTRIGKDLVGTLISDIVQLLFGYVAENERTTIRQRQAEGIAAAKERGVHFGPEPKPLPDNFPEVYQEWKHNKLTVTEAAAKSNMARSSFYYRAKLYEKLTSKNK